MVFALWTLACHIAVGVQGNTFVLLVMAVASAMGAGTLWAIHRARRPGRPGGDEETCDHSEDGEPVSADESPPPQSASPGDDTLPSRQGIPVGKWFLPLYVVLAAAVTVATDKTAILDLFCFSAIVLLAAALFCRQREEPDGCSDVPEPDPHGQLVWLVAAVFAVLALLINRPDLDDCFHTNAAVNVCDFPRMALMSRHTIVFNGPASFWMVPVWRLQTLEVLAGAVAFVTRIDAISVLHLLVPPVAAFLGVLALAGLVRRLLPRHTLWVLLAMLFYTMADGEMNASFGNFGFVRFQQGKGILLTAVLPLIMSYGIDLARSGTWADFWKMVAVQVAAVGLSSTAIWAAPFAAALSMLAAAPLRRDSFKRLSLGALSTLYPLLAGLAYMGSTRQVLAQLPEMRVLPQFILSSAFVNVLGHSPLALSTFFLAITAWIMVPPGPARRFCLRLPFLFFLLVFNPLTVGLVANNLVGARLYYRTVWLLQAPLLVALVLVSPAFDLSGRSHGWRRVAVLTLPFVYALVVFKPDLVRLLLWRSNQEWAAKSALWNIALSTVFLALAALGLLREPRVVRIRVLPGILVCLLFFWCFPFQHVLSPRNATMDGMLSFGTPSLKVDPQAHRMARTINANVEPGAAVVAPLGVAALIPTFHNHALPVIARVNHLSFMAVGLGADEAMRRLQLMHIAGGRGDGPYTRVVIAEGYRDLRKFPDLTIAELPDAVVALGGAVDTYGLEAVCLSFPENRERLTGMLEQKGFRGWALPDCPRYELWLRDRERSQVGKSKVKGRGTEGAQVGAQPRSAE